MSGDGGGTDGSQPPDWSLPGGPRPAPPPWPTQPPAYGSWPAQPPAYGTWPTPWGPAQGQQPWPVAQQEPPRRTNPWAVVALVTGILALVPVAVAAGITALVQIGRRRQSGTGLAIAGLATAAVWTVAAVIVGVVVLLMDAVPSGDLGRVASAGSAQVGTCLRDAAPGGSPPTPVECTAEHDAEVYLVTQLEDGHWPGGDQVDAEADFACYSAFRGYVGESYTFSEFEYGYFMPDLAEWAGGERRVLCAVLPGPFGDLQGSVRGSGR